MASGHVNRTNRPNTWLHRPATRREESPCQSGAVHTWHTRAIPISLAYGRYRMCCGPTENRSNDWDWARMTHKRDYGGTRTLALLGVLGDPAPRQPARCVVVFRPNGVAYETARIHYASWRRSSRVAGCGAGRAASKITACRRVGIRLAALSVCRYFHKRLARAWLYGRPQYRSRVPLYRGAKRSSRRACR
jgi:hypothetical protein